MAIGLTVGAFIVFLMKLEPGKGSDTVKREKIEQQQKATKIAEANKVAAVQDAEAAAEAVRLAGIAERDRQVALAAGVRAEGEARGAAIAAEGLAEAQAIDAKAEALKKYGEAALAQEIIGRLPEITRAVAEPLGSIANLTVISNEGASAITRTVTDVASEIPAVVKNLTGLDLSALLGGAAGAALSGAADKAAAPAAAVKRAAAKAAEATPPAV